MNNYYKLLATLISSFVLFSGCTNDSGDDREPKTNACGTIGLTAKVEGKIINGTACSSGPSPVVLVLIETNSGQTALCTGTMLTSTDVVTAAHCFQEAPRRVGVFNMNQTQASAVSQVIVHPEAVVTGNVELFENDVTILKLASPLNLPTMPLFLSRDVDGGDIISIFGFGRDNNENSGQLRSGEMKVNEVSEGHIVATFDEEQGSNTCFGDSGGPALLTAEGENGETVTGLVGITSSGTKENCEAGDRSAFAEIQYQKVLDFILQHVPNAKVV